MSTGECAAPFSLFSSSFFLFFLLEFLRVSASLRQKHLAAGRTCPARGEGTNRTPAALGTQVGSDNLTSTRRFCLRPSRVLLSAAGLAVP